MEKKDLILLIMVFTIAGFSIYRKYFMKDKGKIGSAPSQKSSSMLSSKSKDDDYEPYSKK